MFRKLVLFISLVVSIRNHDVEAASNSSITTVSTQNRVPADSADSINEGQTITRNLDLVGVTQDCTAETREAISRAYYQDGLANDNIALNQERASNTRRVLKDVIFNDPVLRNNGTSYAVPVGAPNVLAGDNRLEFRNIPVWVIDDNNVNPNVIQNVQARYMVLTYNDEEVFALAPPSTYDEGKRKNTVVTVTCVEVEGISCNVHCVFGGLRIN